MINAKRECVYNRSRGRDCGRIPTPAHENLIVGENASLIDRDDVPPD